MVNFWVFVGICMFGVVSMNLFFLWFRVKVCVLWLMVSIICVFGL